MRRLVKVGLPLLILLGGCGCTDNREEPGQLKNEIEQYLEKKYEGNFSVLSIQSPEIWMDYGVCRVIREGTDAKTDYFTVKHYRNKSKGVPYFEDDYFGLLLREDMERTVSNLSALEESEIKVYIKRFLFPDFFYTFKNDDTLETVKNAGNTLDADYYIFIKAVDMDMAYGEEFREQTETLFMQMALITQPGLVRVYALRENTFNEIDRGNFETYLNDYYRADMDQCIAVARKVVKVDE